MDINEVCLGGMSDYFRREHPGEQLSPVDDDQVELCREFIRDHCRPHRRGFSSYHLKHVVEEYYGTYIANGSFIAAAILEGCRTKRFNLGPNVQVFLKYDIQPLRES